MVLTSGQMGTVWAATGSAATAATATATATAANSIKSLPLKLEGCGYRQVAQSEGGGVKRCGERVCKLCRVARKTGKLN